MAPFSPRAFLTKLHRYTGLVLAAFLFMSGVTGSIIAFWPELDVALNADLYTARASGEALSPSMLAAKVEAADPQAQVIYVPVRLSPGEAAAVFVKPRVDPATKEPYTLDYDHAFVDPASGEIFGRRLWGGCCLDRKHLIPFLHMLHYTLYLPGRWGVWVMGLIALAWFIDCFVALSLTFPRRKPFFARWGSSFRIQRGAGAGRLLLDLHRAGGLWLWLVLGTVALTGFGINLYAEMFRPAVSAILPVTPESDPTISDPSAPLIGFDAALVRGQEEARRRGWETPGGVYLDVDKGIYSVSFQRSQQDRGDWSLGTNELGFDGATGALVKEHIHGVGRAGDYVLEAQFPLHSGRLAGLPGRILISISGVVVAVLSVTGVLMWSRRRRAQARLRRDLPAAA
jgi:uncharacterized iron-regulated membrane protein